MELAEYAHLWNNFLKYYSQGSRKLVLLWETEKLQNSIFVRNSSVLFKRAVEMFY